MRKPYSVRTLCLNHTRSSTCAGHTRLSREKKGRKREKKSGNARKNVPSTRGDVGSKKEVKKALNQE
jgi:hypothetical protein